MPIDSDVSLVNDATTGLIADHSTNWIAPPDPGLVTISSLAALNLIPAQGLEVAAKLSGRVLNVAVTHQGTLGLFRCVELADLTLEELLGVFFPTFAFVEDEMKARPEKLLLAGFGDLSETMAEQMRQELNVTVEPMRSRFGMPGPQNAGLFGFLQNLGEAWPGGATMGGSVQ